MTSVTSLMTISSIYLLSQLTWRADPGALIAGPQATCNAATVFQGFSGAESLTAEVRCKSILVDSRVN